MSYSLLTYSPNEILTSAKMNQASDNDEALKDGSALDSNIIYDQHIVDGEVLDSKWRNGVAFGAYRSSSQNMTASTFVRIAFDTEMYDIGADYDNASTFRFVAPYNGVYHFSGSVRSTESAREILSAYKNGSEYHRLYDHATASAANKPYAFDIYLNAGDYVEIHLWVATTSETVTSSPGTIPSFFTGHMVTRT